MRLRLSLSLLLVAGIAGAASPPADENDNEKWIASLGGRALLDKEGRIVGVDLEKSWIADADLARLGAIATLEVLNLAHTRVTDLGFLEMKDLKNVRELNLYYAEQVGDGALAVVKHWPQLRTLNLRGSKVTDGGLEHLAEHPALESIDVGFSLVTDGGFQYLTTIPTLRHVAVGGNKVTDKGLNALRLLLNLTSLDLSGAQRTDSGLWAATVTDAGLEAIASLSRLEELNLQGGKFGDAGCEQLSRLQNLKALTLAKTQVSARCLEALQQMTNLERLSLWDAERVGDDAVPLLAAVSTLRWLDASGTKISEEGLTRIREANPRIRVLPARQ